MGVEWIPLAPLANTAGFYKGEGEGSVRGRGGRRRRSCIALTWSFDELKIESRNIGAPSRIQSSFTGMEPGDCVFFFSITAPALEPLRVIFDPLKGLKRLIDLFGRGEALKDVILEEGIRWVVLLFALKDNPCMSEALDLCNMRLFLCFTAHIALQEFHDGLARRGVFSLHLPFGGFPGRSGATCSRAFDDQEMCGTKGLVGGVEEDTGAQKDSPPLGGMLHVGVPLFGIK